MGERNEFLLHGNHGDMRMYARNKERSTTALLVSSLGWVIQQTNTLDTHRLSGPMVKSEDGVSSRQSRLVSKVVADSGIPGWRPDCYTLPEWLGLSCAGL